nr:MAG TPA: hypothetical protein [Caudoviricetes sp.]
MNVYLIKESCILINMVRNILKNSITTILIILQMK